MSFNIMNKYRTRSREFCDEEASQCCDDPCIENRDGNAVCINCGVVKGRAIVGNETRAYTAQEIEERRHREPRWRGFGPRTILPNEKRDYHGNALGTKEKTLFSRLSKIQKSLVSSIERNLWEAKPKLKQLVSKLNIPEYIEETAWKIYMEVAKKQLTMGRTIDGFVAASLYAAIRVHEFPRLLEDISNISLTSRHTVVRSLGMIIKEVLPELGLKYQPITENQLIFRFGNQLELPMQVQKKALKLLIRASKGGLQKIGKDPKGFAASVIYIAAKSTEHKMTQAEVSEVAGITEVTLRSRIKDIKSRIK
ncbi:MAG: hypothetical protein P8Y70_17420 [Candidatus Lokiarchaeota archaeon]